MEKLDSALCQWIILYIHYFNFVIFTHFANQITLHQNLAQKLNLIFKVNQTKWQINIPLWTHMGHKEWREDGKTFTRCYTIALKFWDEFNPNFVLLYFSSYTSIKIWNHYFKINKHLALVLIKICTYTFLCIPN